MLIVIQSSPEQEEKIYKKHLRHRVSKLEFSCDSDDWIGFVTCLSIRGSRIEYQFRRDIPMFFGMIVGNIRYDIHYPKGKILERLKELGLKAQSNFWKGGQI